MRTLAVAPPCGPTDCADIVRCWGLHTAVPVFAPTPLTLRCDFKSDGGGWTILQQRRDYSVDFYRKWAEYKRGFGTEDTFWLGLDTLHRLTRNRESKMRVEVTFGRFRTSHYAEYDGVTFGNATAFYALNYSVYNRRSRLQDGLRNHSGPFCTTDAPAGEQCQRLAMYGRTAWWFGKGRPFGSDLNAVLFGSVQRQSVYWVGVRDISHTQIKFRPSTFGLVAADCDKSCPNGGTCLGAANGTFHCRCAPGYTGRSCESTYLPALPCFCFHDGTCLVGGSCACTPGFTGSKCQVEITSGGAARPSPGSGVRPGNGTRDGRDNTYRWVRLEVSCRCSAYSFPAL